jgi:hypothetical protein
MFKALQNLQSEKVCRGRDDWILTFEALNDLKAVRTPLVGEWTENVRLIKDDLTPAGRPVARTAARRIDAGRVAHP